MPDARPPGLVDRIAARCEVLPFPIDFPCLATADRAEPRDVASRHGGPHVLWNHRWEHDKDPETFFASLARLHDEGVPFRLIVCGQRFGEVPEVFARARTVLADRIVHWGTIDDSAGYAAMLEKAQIAVSTARHEFFGVGTLEAVDAGARPLVPDRLAYPEHFPADCRYANAAALEDRLRSWCRDWAAGRLDLRADRREWTRRYAAETVVPRLVERLAELTGQDG